MYHARPMLPDDPAAVVCAALDRLGLSYERFDHPPAFTVEQALEHWTNIRATHCKNLFLRNKKGDRHVLVVAPIERDVDLVALSRVVGGGRLSFASPERMREHLGLTPGSVSPFGLLNDPGHRVELMLDAALKRSERVAFHPNINTSTLTLTLADFERFLASTGHSPRFLDLDRPLGGTAGQDER
ncbi:MAG: prolyl-tRNA synthetase associated domain-containing protein [Vicinamibacterales bacterium]